MSISTTSTLGAGMICELSYTLKTDKTSVWKTSHFFLKTVYLEGKSVINYRYFTGKNCRNLRNFRRGVNHFWNLVSLHWNLTGISPESHGISESFKNLLESSESHWNPWNLTGIPGILSESLESYRNPWNLIGIPGISLESLESY